MTPAEYQKIYTWFTARPAAKKVLCTAAKLLPLISILLYPFLVLLRMATAWEAVQNGSPALPVALETLARTILVPAFVFLGGSALRRILNYPRPYEQPGFVPLMQKSTKGQSFPSRHCLSASVIAMAWLAYSPAAGIALTLTALLVAVTRVLTGVHAPKDVLAGLALGFVVGGLGMFL